MTSATTGLPADVEAYLSALRSELSDLAADERDDLLAEVEASLLESAGDERAVADSLGVQEGHASLAAQFGPPAADLRASAGLPPKPAVRAPREPRVDWARVLGQMRVLAPIWWLVRGYVAVAAIALLANARFSARQPAIPWFGSVELGAAAIAAGVLVSVAIGLFARVPRPLAIAGNAILALALIPVVAHLASPERKPVQSDLALEVLRMKQVEAASTASSAGLSYRGQPLENVYAYDRRGRLLHDVRLYGENGLPLEIRPIDADPSRRVPATTDGQVLNAYPIRYFDPGTRKVSHPDAGPPVDAPPITTPLK